MIEFVAAFSIPAVRPVGRIEDEPLRSGWVEHIGVHPRKRGGVQPRKVVCVPMCGETRVEHVAKQIALVSPCRGHIFLAPPGTPELAGNERPQNTELQ